MPDDQPSTVERMASDRVPLLGSSPGLHEVAPPQALIPIWLDRYCVTEVLGTGGFGVVYKGFDEELKRHVAIKVPHRHRIRSPQDIESYLAEARALARLDHPGIVPVYDVGRTDDGLCFIVSKFVEGADLRTRIRQAPLARAEAVQIVAAVAEALHHAHQRGIVHRDIKPANILLDNQIHPIVADFGLALREEDLGKCSSGGGTPQYMSPEQARGEGHRVDSRSDVYSLGVVLYELLTGQRPFAGGNDSEVLERIRSHEPRPPRQIDDSIPRELDRICLKALAKRATDRYSTALDLAEDLHHWLGLGNDRAFPAGQSALIGSECSAAGSLPAGQSALDTERRSIRIVPKGLRSFDAGDADFFLELLPGPRDRERLPESLRFWKKRIEDTEPDRTFTIGLLYGPSGCGKSSLVKAGLLPRLAEHVITVLVEASRDDTERQLLNALRRRCLELPAEEDLAGTLTFLRRGQGPQGKKVLIVIDQFEQWLHAKREDPAPVLVRALRHCDGEHVQALVLVRDDFWMATTRFMRELEVPLVEGQNSAAVDLFDVRHARRVLAAFGRAFGALPERDATPEQEAFIDRAAEGLAQEGKVIPVRLSVFAEMVKHKPWVAATLKKVGGAEGVGIAFLEETFSETSAPPEHRLHQKAARAVLRALLPEQRTEIKGHRRSRQELLDASGYGARPGDFDDLVRILDAELRLITPSDPEGDADPAQPVGPDRADVLASASTVAGMPVVAAPRYYQLTHDYLVPALRQWLTRKQKETWRGRAELRLQERTADWLARRRARFLPSLPEYLNITLAVPPRKRKADEQAMMRAATRRLAAKWGVALLALAALVFGIERYVAWVHYEAELRRAEGIADQVINVSPASVPNAMASLISVGDLARPLVRRRFEVADEASNQKLRAACALAALGEVHGDYLISRISTAPPSEARNIITALSHGNSAVTQELAQKAKAERALKPRLRYASTLLHLGDSSSVKEMLQPGPDPAARTAFILGFCDWHAELRRLPSLLQNDDSPGFRSGVCAAVGRIDPNSLAIEERAALERVFAELARNGRDGGTHGAALWALRQWQAPAPDFQECRVAANDRRWFVNSLGMSMLQVGPGPSTAGDAASPAGGASASGPIPQSYYLSSCEVSVDQFQRFLADVDFPAEEKPVKWEGHYVEGSPTPACPVQRVSWFDAVLFCNWLSHKEGRQLCYRRTGATQRVRVGNMDLTWDVWECDPRADGYRLPTDIEWELACRAGTSTTFAFGDNPDYLREFGTYAGNTNRQTRPAGTWLPNSWGFFDMHGNVGEWCWDWFADFKSDDAHPGKPRERTQKVWRGGSCSSVEPAECASSLRRSSRPDRRDFGIGFRVACGLGAQSTDSSSPAAP